ncbi:Ig-like domain-containing protein [Frankia sp. R82]|nr:Ig-like domain-containing protein [Frankia sp. R82]
MTVSASPATPLFGQAVTLTATVTTDPAAGTPTGTVTFLDGAAALGTAMLDGGQATLAVGGLQPGPHPVTVTYSGDAAHAPSQSAAATTVTVGFSQPCLTSARSGPLTVAAGQSLCLGAGGRQSGPVTVRAGGALAVTGATISGPVSADGALAITACGATISGPVSIHATSGYVQLGNPSACAGNTISGPLTVEANRGGLTVAATTVTGPVRINDNSGTGPVPGSDVPSFTGNRVSGPLSCTGNQPTLRQSGNTVTGPRSGQCA